MSEPLLAAARAVRAAVVRRRERRYRDLANVPDAALKMGVAGLVAHREQCCDGEHACDAWWELADLRWVLARRAAALERSE